MATGSLWNCDSHFALSIAGRFYVGQNMLGIRPKTKKQVCAEEWEDALKVMFREVVSFNSSHVSPFQ
jgi:hypothetical protein